MANLARELPGARARLSLPAPSAFSLCARNQVGHNYSNNNNYNNKSNEDEDCDDNDQGEEDDADEGATVTSCHDE